MYTQDISRAFEEAIGKDGADKLVFTRFLKDTEKGVASLAARKKDNSLPLLNLAAREDDLKLIEDTAKRITEGFKTLIVIGLGGSSYGGKTLCALAHNPFVPPPGTDVHFVDNIDPATAALLLESIDVKTTMFLLVSKSGDTAETLAHALILTGAIESRLGKPAVRDHFIVITEPKDSALKRLAEAHGIATLDHDPRIGGRFSGISNVGLLPAKVRGIDIRAVRHGAAEVTREVFESKESEPAKGAALHAALEQKGRTLAVLMPYCDRLEVFNIWYRQLWAESIGKGGRGTTPVSSLGACDQHSQLQLYLDGPRDKFFSLLLLEQAGKGPRIPETNDATLSYLSGRSLGDLMDAEQRATAETLIRNRCPVRIFGLKELDAEAMGALVMHFMFETMIMGELMGINAFDQPAVEEGKVLARKYLGQT